MLAWFLLSHRNRDEERGMKIQRRKEKKKKPKCVMKRMFIVIESEVQMSTNEAFVFSYFTRLFIAITHICLRCIHMLLRQNDVQRANKCQH
jgi:hypothetical protein